MHFSCEKETIVKEISIAQEIISSRNALSILSNVLLETRDNVLTIKATDLKVSFETYVDVDTKTPGSITVFCDKFLGILRSLPAGEIDFQLEKELLLYIRPVFQKIDFKLKSISAEKYPEIKEIPEDKYFEFSQDSFLDMISKTLFAVSTDETRYFMNGVYFEKLDDALIMVATDGRRLSYITKEADQKIETFKGIIIPPKILNLLKKLLPGEGNITLAINEQNIFIRFNRHKLSSNLIDAQFPNYQRVIPQEQSHQIQVNRKALQDALHRVSLLVEEKSRRILISIQPGNLVISSAEGDIGMAKEEMPCEYDGPEINIALNYIYLIDPLKECKEEYIKIEFTEKDKAITLRPIKAKDYFHIVMPMQTG